MTTSTVAPKTWTVEEIRTLIETKDAAVERALVRLWTLQTADEQAVGVTKHRNGCGFNGRDAEFGSSLARQVEAGRRLSARQLECARKFLKKYAGQLAKVANAAAPAASVSAPEWIDPEIEQADRECGLV